MSTTNVHMNDHQEGQYEINDEVCDKIFSTAEKLCTAKQSNGHLTQSDGYGISCTELF